MLLRYKLTEYEFESESFNPNALCEVLTGDDSAFCSELDVFIGDRWMDFKEAFKTRALITDNYNLYFGEPQNEEDKNRGYWL